MISKRLFLALSLSSLIAACGGGGAPAEVPQAQPAENTNVTIGDHVVHFSALTTDQLPAEVAKVYDIVRSKNRAMLNVSVLTAADGTPVNADVTVDTSNLTGQVKNITMREITEQEAIYYIGVTPVANQETLIFELSIQPAGDSETHTVRFQRKFYTD